MSTLVVPPIEETPYPTLGPQVAAFIEAYLVHGPGDLRSQPARLDQEKRALLYRMYEVYPQGHPQAGRRRFRRVAISLRKGSAKTEFAAWVAACELHPDAPVRCAGFDGKGDPVGVGVISPYIPMLAYTEEQSEDLAYGALKAILEDSPLRDDFDIGLERVMRREGDGKAVALASAPDARDGALTTFEHFDETHRFTLPRLIEVHKTMLANLPKRRLADPWALETTTAPAPGAGSVAERTMEYARAVADGARTDARLFFFHRQAGGEAPIELDTRDQIRAAVLEASGPVAAWSDVDGIVDQWDDPTADRAYLERVWLNRLVRSSGRAFDAEKWRGLARPGTEIPDGDLIVLGFDGSRRDDATALVATHVESGHQWVVGVWEAPEGIADWTVPEQEVDDAVHEAFRRWDVWRLDADPPLWDRMIAEWIKEFGDERVAPFDTKRPKLMGETILSYANAITLGELTHEGHPAFARHVGNACRRPLPVLDDKGVRLWTVQKERPGSPHKIDLAVAGAISWRARLAAIAAGAVGAGRSALSDPDFRIPELT